AGLVLGSLFPLIAGIQGFMSEWGAVDVSTTLTAYKTLARMQLYEAATFGSRGNTAAFLVIVAPLLMWIPLDKSRSRLLRTVCAVALVPVFMNLMILQIRAAFLVLLVALAVIWGFKLGLKRYPLFLVALGLVAAL